MVEVTCFSCFSGLKSVHLLSIIPSFIFLEVIFGHLLGLVGACFANCIHYISSKDRLDSKKFIVTRNDHFMQYCSSSFYTNVMWNLQTKEVIFKLISRFLD